MKQRLHQFPGFVLLINGGDPVSAPWFNLGLQYDGKVGDRINCHHLSLAKKYAALEKIK